MYGIGLKKIKSNFFKTAGRQIAGNIIQLSITIIIARVFGPDGNGSYILAIVFPTLLSFCLNFGITSTNVYFIGSQKVSLKKIWHYNLLFYFPLAVLGLIVGIIIIHFFSDQLFQGVESRILWLSLFIFPPLLLTNYITGLMQGLQDFSMYNKVYITQPVLTVILISVLLLLGFNELFYVLGGYFVSVVASMLICLFWIFKQLKEVNKKRKIQRTDIALKKMVSYGLKSQLTNLFNFLNYRADLFIVNYFLGPSFTGLYIISVKICEKLWFIPSNISLVLFPKLSELSTNEIALRKLTPLVSRSVLTVTFLGCLILAIIASPLIIILFGSEFSASVKPLFYLLPGVLSYSVSKVIANDIAAREKPELNMMVSIAMFAENLFLNILLVPKYGISGAAIATSISYSTDLVCKIVIYRKLSSLSFSDILLSRRSDLSQLRSGSK